MTESQLPITFDGDFYVERYLVTHSELKLRSSPSSSANERIEIKFYDVVGLRLKTKTYRTLEIAYADEDQAREMIEFAEIRTENIPRVVVVALKSGGPDSLVACSSFTVYSYPEDTRASGEDGPVLIARHAPSRSG